MSRFHFLSSEHPQELKNHFKGQKLLNKWFYKTNRIVPVALSKECSDSISDIYGLKKTDIVLNGVPEFKKSNDFDNCLNFFQNLKSSILNRYLLI